jgi:CRP-like cAMP-binding protein
MDIVEICIKALLEEKRFFHNFTPSELEILTPFFHLNRCQPDEVLIEEGSAPGGPFSIIVSGSLEIKKRTEFGRHIVLAKVSRGALIGYGSIHRMTRPFAITATALEKTELLYIPPDDFNRLLEEYPQIGVKILREVIRVQDIRLQELLERFTSTM